MAVHEALERVRTSDYGFGKDNDQESGSDEKDADSKSRVIQLSDDEMKGLAGYVGAPGEEVRCEVTGTLEEDGHFHVMSVSAPGGGMGQDAMQKVAGLDQAPVMRSQTQISPS